MALTARQRNKLPRSAFLDPKNKRFPAPTKAQARKAGIPETQRVKTLRNALSRAAQSQARGVKKVTPTLARRKVATRAAGQVESVRSHPAARRRRTAAARRNRSTRRR